MVTVSVLACIGLIFPFMVSAQVVKSCRPTPTCPRDDGCTATISNGAMFKMMCSTDYSGNVIEVAQVNTKRLEHTSPRTNDVTKTFL